MLDTPTTPPDGGTQLYTISAGGFSATVDAFARDEQTAGLWFLSMLGSQTAVKRSGQPCSSNRPRPRS